MQIATICLLAMLCLVSPGKKDYVGHTMTVSQFKKCKTFNDVHPALPPGWKLESFQMDWACRRCDFVSYHNTGETFDSIALRHINAAKVGHLYIFGNPIYADSFGTKVVTNRFDDYIKIIPD